MELFNSQTLDEVGYFSEQKLKEILFQVLHAIAYVHSKGIALRDISPREVLYDPQTGIVKLFDFVQAKRFRVNGVETDMLTTTGSRLYRAPEIMVGRWYGKTVDIWSAGIMIHKLVAMRNLFSAEYYFETLKLIKEAEVRLPVEFKRCSPELMTLVLRML
jgi:serine/threonine protein kinase